MTGVWFHAPNPALAHHVAPLRSRLLDLEADSTDADVVVLAHETLPTRDAHYVQLFHGVGDKGHTLNPRLLQRGQARRIRQTLDHALLRVGMRPRFMRPPSRSRRRASVYETVNAYGPYFRDRLEALLKDACIPMCGHGALNDLGGVQVAPDGPVLWAPTWDSRVKYGGPAMTGLASHAQAFLRMADEVPVSVKWHPMVARFRQYEEVRRRFDAHPGIDVLPMESSIYEALPGKRGVVTDTSSVGFEAYTVGLPVAIARPPGFRAFGLHAMMEERTPFIAPGDLEYWAAAPEPPSDRKWASDLVIDPDPCHNDRLASHVRQIVAGEA